MKKFSFVWLASITCFGSMAFALDRLPLAAKLPSVEKLPASCSIVLRVDFPGLQRIPFVARYWSPAPDATDEVAAQASLFSQTNTLFNRRFLEDIHEMLLFQMNSGTNPTNRISASAAYLRGAFSRSALLKKSGETPIKKLTGVDVYSIASTNKVLNGSCFAFIAENAMLIGENEQAMDIALNALCGRAPSLTRKSPFARMFQRNRAPILGMAVGGLFPFAPESEQATVDTGSMVPKMDSRDILGASPSSYLLSLASSPVSVNSARVTMEMTFEKEAEMLQARENLKAVLGLFLINARNVPGLAKFLKRFEISGVYKSLRIILEIDEQTMTLFGSIADAMSTVPVFERPETMQEEPPDPVPPSSKKPGTMKRDPATPNAK